MFQRFFSNEPTTEPKTELERVQNWIDFGYVDGRMSKQMEEAQHAEFLYHSPNKRAAVGQRAEVCFARKGRRQPYQAGSCRLSGEVVQVLSNPEDVPIRLQTGWGDKVGSLTLTRALGMHHEKEALPGAVVGADGWRIYMSPETWESTSAEVKAAVIKLANDSYGGLHGQEVVCEGRLNFVFDRRRSSEEGPWGDGIPFDARDVWRFKLRFDDHLDHMWTLDVESLENLGRDVRPRCWPWSEGTELPFERCDHDHFFEYANPESQKAVMCRGPFGCSYHPTVFTSRDD
jgi:hypothetical protein